MWDKPIGFVIPTRLEARTILKRFSFCRIARDTYEATVHGHPVWILISGVGAERARAAAEALYQRGAGLLVSAGFCGALIPTLRVGDLITERIATSEVPVTTPAERRALVSNANAEAVDMETRAVIEQGTLRGIPIRILRVVSDTLDDDLSLILGHDRQFSPVRIAFRLLNPLAWPLALRLARQSAVARDRLADAFDMFTASPQ